MNGFTHNPNARLEQQRQQLENLLQQDACQTVQRPSRWRQFWSQTANALVHWLTAGNEPRIHHLTVGDTEVWKIYDPGDDSVHYFTAEDDVRIWLDQRYHQ